MNFHDKKVIPPKYIYLFLTIVCFILLFFSVIFSNRVSVLKSITGAVITPMQTGVNAVGTGIYNRVTDKKEMEALAADNQELQSKLDDANAQIKLYEQESYELKRLQELLALQEQYSDFNTIGARVIATDSTNWFYSFVIDKGKEEGIQVGCNVLANGGLAGIVTEVGNHYAKVRAVIDDNSQVSAAVSGTDTLCTVSGDLSAIREGYIKVDYINKSDTIEEGAELVTSHISSKFLPGILIGYVTEITMDANNLTQSAKCIPVVDFRNLQEVLVVLDLKANYKTDSLNQNIYNDISEDSSNSPSKTDTEDVEDEESSEDAMREIDPFASEDDNAEDSENGVSEVNQPDSDGSDIGD